MRVFRSCYRNRGRACQTRKWYVEFRDPLGRARRVAGFTDKSATLEFGRKLERLSHLRSAGQEVPPELVRWIETLPNQLAQKLGSLGLLESSRLAASRPLSDLLAEWEASLRARGRTEKHIRLTSRRAERLLRDTGARVLSDINPAKVEAALSQARQQAGLGLSSSNHPLAALRSFIRWAVESGFVSEDPLRILRPLNARPDRRLVRRALEPEEIRRLLTATEVAGPWKGLSGTVRALLYRLAIETGLRSSEIRSLRVSAFEDLAGDRPRVRLLAAYSKRKREDVLPLRSELAFRLAGHVEHLHPWDPAFALTPSWRAAEMLRRDLAAAEITPEDESGRVVDFHALRTTFCTRLARSSVAPKVAQALARHSSFAMTFDTYAQVGADDERAALEALPDLTPSFPVEARQAACSRPLSASYSASGRASGCSAVHAGASANPIDAPETQDSGSGGGTRTPDTRIMIPLL